MLNPIAKWLLSLMVWLAPPEKVVTLQTWPEAQETLEEKQMRYESIAKDLYEVLYDPEEKPIFGGSKGRANTAALMLAIAFKESGFAKDTDLGPCAKNRCDGHRSATMFQILIGKGMTREGWTQADLFADRKKAIRASLHMVQRSVKTCWRSIPEHRLAVYASGSCERGLRESRLRVELARRLLGHSPPPDVDVVFLLPGVS